MRLIRAEKICGHRHWEMPVAVIFFTWHIPAAPQ
jgi:hypothetical protein